MLRPDARLGIVQYDPNHVVTQLEFPLFVVTTTVNPNVSAPARPIAAVLYLPLDHGCDLRTPKLAPHLALVPYGDPSVSCSPSVQAETAQLNGAIAALFYLPPITPFPQPLATNATIPLFQLAQFPDGRDLASRLASQFATPDPLDPVRIDGLIAAGHAGMGDMWHVTMVVVVVLLATALAVSVAMHALMWRRRRVNARRRRVRGMAVGVEEEVGMDVVDEAMLHVLPLREYAAPPTTSTATTGRDAISEKPGAVVAVPAVPPATAVVTSPEIAAALEPTSAVDLLGTNDASPPPSTPPTAAPPRSLLHTLFPLLPTATCGPPLTTTCAICLDDLVPRTLVRVLPCRHAFHPPCIDPWLTTRSAQCPLCKADVRVGMVRDEDAHWRRWWAWARPDVVRDTRASPLRMYTPVPGVPSGVVDVGGRGRVEEGTAMARTRGPVHAAQERVDER